MKPLKSNHVLHRTVVSGSRSNRSLSDADRQPS